MSFILWDVPIKADSFRSVDLEDYKCVKKSLFFTLIEEDSEEIWILSFESFHAFSITTEECASGIRKLLPCYGGFFKSAQSEWLTLLGKGRVSFLNDAYHFIICCYDEVIELVASEKSISFSRKI